MSSVADFLIERLENAGVKHVFGIPGDYVLDFYDKLWHNPKIDVVNTTDEAHAGFAADAYARVAGIGCVCVTYNVGALKLANAVACAYAERSPLVIISGSPGIKERTDNMLLHHMVRSFNCQKEIFEKITCDSVVLDNPAMAGYYIDRAFESLKHYKQPIYIELPRDIANKPLVYDVYKLGTPTAPKSDPENLTEAVEEVTKWVQTSERPVIMAGVEVARFGLGEKLMKFAERHNIPVVTEYLSKSVVPERHPLFAGLYSGPASDESIRKLVDESDCLLMFGVMLTDMTLNFMPAKFTKRQVVFGERTEGSKSHLHRCDLLGFL
jgi:indolepyruvate decarboxylase